MYGNKLYWNTKKHACTIIKTHFKNTNNYFDVCSTALLAPEPEVQHRPFEREQCAVIPTAAVHRNAAYSTTAHE